MQDITDLLARVGELLSGVNVQRTIVRETATRKRVAAALPPSRPVPTRESALIFRDALRVAGKRPNDKGVLISMGSTVERQDQIEAIRAFIGYDDKRDVFGVALSSAQSTMRRVLMGPVTEVIETPRGIGFTPGSAEHTLLAKAVANWGALHAARSEINARFETVRGKWLSLTETEAALLRPVYVPLLSELDGKVEELSREIEALDAEIERLRSK